MALRNPNKIRLLKMPTDENGHVIGLPTQGKCSELFIEFIQPLLDWAMADNTMEFNQTVAESCVTIGSVAWNYDELLRTSARGRQMLEELENDEDPNLRALFKALVTRRRTDFAHLDFNLTAEVVVGEQGQLVVRAYVRGSASDLEPTLSRPSEKTARATKINANQTCPCGSGKKYKKCCSHADRPSQ